MSDSAGCRQQLLDRVREDLMGPQDEHEVLPERPTDRYLTGILFAAGEDIPQDENEQSPEAAVDAPASESPEREEVGLHSGFRPATMGVSFSVPRGSDLIQVFIEGGRYRQRWLVGTDGTDEADLRTGAEADRHAREKLTDQNRGREDERWVRHPVSLEVSAALESGYRERPLNELSDQPGAAALGLGVQVDDPDGDRRRVTVVLINRGQPEGKRGRAGKEEAHLYQASLRVRLPGGDGFVPRYSRYGHRLDDDAEINELLYRDVREFAAGHTCSARWEEEKGECTEVGTAWFPEATVYPTSHEGDRELQNLAATEVGGSLFSARWLAGQEEPGELCEVLRALPDAYLSWIDRQEGRIPDLDGDFLRDRARENLELCRQSARRMKDSVDLLGSDSRVRQAFQLAQRAMHLQFSRQERDANLIWRPFQLAFQLQALVSLAVPEHPDRSVMDLLWFPTGGGKTEAYLALTAFVLFHRRLREKPEDEDGGGVGVITRYTLRLLTIQQFERAARLLCACEGLRQGLFVDAATDDLGDEPFRVGLWVGGGATPNRREEAMADPIQARLLRSCPWCDEGLPAPRRGDYRARCGNEECPFSSIEALPVLTVDEDIYETPPSLLIGTIDKFAQLARNGHTGRLFGRGTPHLAPDFILQDELHLISGPLGTITGLYESVVDMICSSNGQRPKVIGSTATIRRAASQVRSLFNREVAQFPPPALDADNSFFAVTDMTAPGREYVGVTTAGRSPKYSLQALAASLLQGAGGLRNEVPEPALDPYWTLVGYFNSLRELGGALVLMEDDVRASVEAYASRRGEETRQLEPPRELTSRVPSGEIPKILQELMEGLQGDGVPPDSVLATNMISVGVDIPRLGLMVVNGQPKTMAEYIQATSRVGREHPGLIVSLFNAMRTRDRSHYESFETWHQSLYREVEATSVTPFAARARDRALKGVLVAMCRHLIDGMREDPSLTEERRREADSLVSNLLSRARSIHSSRTGSEELLQELEGEIQKILDSWEEKGSLSHYWANSSGQAGSALLVSAEQHAAATSREDGWVFGLWPALNSMREVEPSVEFRLWSR